MKIGSKIALFYTVITVGAIALALYERSGDYSEAVAVMLFYQIGELFGKGLSDGSKVLGKG